MREYKTQMEAAKKGIVTSEMKTVACLKHARKAGVDDGCRAAALADDGIVSHR